MKKSHAKTISTELNLKESQVDAVQALLKDGATVPFIARYRKEATDSLDEVIITSIRDRLQQLSELDLYTEFLFRSDWTLAASGAARVKLHYFKKRTAEYRITNFEGWNRFAPSLY